MFAFQKVGGIRLNARDFRRVALVCGGYQTDSGGNSATNLHDLFGTNVSYKAIEKIRFDLSVTLIASVHSYGILVNLKVSKVVSIPRGAMVYPAQLRVDATLDSKHRPWLLPHSRGTQSSHVRNLGVKMPRKDIDSQPLAKFESASHRLLA
jgi:hypothetical protein